MPRVPQDRPLVSVNFAITWDGRIATRRRTPTDFTSKEDKRRLLELRALADAVLVSARTAASDRMRLGLPSAKLRAERMARGQQAYPLRVLVTNSGRLALDLPLWETHTAPVVVFSTIRMPRRARAALAERAELRLDPSGRVNLAGLMKSLRREFGVRRLHCEGGGELFRSLLAEGLVDDIYLTLCPRVFGGVQAPTLTGVAGEHLPRSTECRLVHLRQVGGECFLHYRVLGGRRLD